jgi:hypothetical protein
MGVARLLPGCSGLGRRGRSRRVRERCLVASVSAQALPLPPPQRLDVIEGRKEDFRRYLNARLLRRYWREILPARQVQALWEGRLKLFHADRIEAAQAFLNEPPPNSPALAGRIGHRKGQQRQVLPRVIQDNNDGGYERRAQLGCQAGLPDDRPPPARQCPRGIRIGVAGRGVLIVSAALERQPQQLPEDFLAER